MHRLHVLVPILLLGSLPLSSLTAQARDSLATDSTVAPAQSLAPLVVTATRTPRALLDVPGAANVISRADLNRRPFGSVASLFADLPGLDVTGVGPNQARPVIRGFSGQRILLLDDGLRVTNSRRQQDFGELPSLLGQTGLDRIEIVRGPASVLYGSDAIGGVVNIVGNALPSLAGGDSFHGDLRFQYTGGAAGISQPSGAAAVRRGPFALRFDAEYRAADPYDAPGGQFGELRLPKSTRVIGTGLDDHRVQGHLGWDVSPNHHLFAKYSDYNATNAGFGLLDPTAAGDGTVVDIRYPKQEVRRGTFGYRGTELGLPVADRVDVAVYRSDNHRKLAQDIFIPFGPGTPPGAGIDIATRNATSVDATGLRLEAGKRVGTRHTLTWGAEFNRDMATGTDSSSNTVIGFGPPTTETSNRPALPRAAYRSFGLFLQDEVHVTGRLGLVLGARYQDNRAETFRTPHLDQTPVSGVDQTLVWAANAVYRLGDGVRVIGAASRGFRSPNLVERFYHGVTPEGNSFQSRNPNLVAETSINVDLGLRIQQPKWSLEAFAFENNLRDGIRIGATGDTVMGFPEYENINVDRLRVRGVELAVTATPFAGATVHGNVTTIDETDTAEPMMPVGSGYGDKLSLGARYRIPSGRIWAGIRYRYEGSREGTLGESTVVGKDFPGFSVIDVDLGVLALQWGTTAHVLTATVENVGNALYAEAGNAGFIRPAPARRLLLAWRSMF